MEPPRKPGRFSTWFELAGLEVSAFDPVVDDVAADAKARHHLLDGQFIGMFERWPFDLVLVTHPLDYGGGKRLAFRAHSAVLVELLSDLRIGERCGQGSDPLHQLDGVADAIGHVGR
jgi:hypothetical protein